MGIIEEYKDEILYYQIKGFNLNNNINNRNQGMQGIQDSEEFILNNNINHLFSTRVGWNQEKIFANLSEVLNIPEEKIYRAKQVHGTDVLIIEDQNYKDILIEQIDGLITNVKGIALATYHADCVPLYFYDKNKEVIGLAHAGWKGTLNNISKSIIKKMIDTFGSNVEDISVAIGPSIGVCCYEIGHDVEKLFIDKHPNNINIIQRKDNKIYLNLWEVNKINLLDSGVKEVNIFYSNICTSCRVDKLYSYRKEKGTKNRMIAAITLNPQN